MKNSNLHSAKRGKNDEFYTQRTDIEKELRHYWPHFKGKSIYCNCDDHENSEFFQYFSLQFEHLGLRELVTTCYKNPALTPWHEGGKTISANCQMLCKEDNRKKSGI